MTASAKMATKSGPTLPPREALVARFWSKVDKSGDCWPWKAGRSNWGYGAFTATRREQVGAHRVSFELENGPIPSGLQVLHRCDNPPCVNPAHLFLGTAADNMHDRWRKGRYATGLASWPTQHREQMPRGCRHGSQTKPEAFAWGERHGCHKLTAEQVHEIRRRRATERMTHRALAADYGVHRSTITLLLAGKNWRRLENDDCGQPRNQEDFQSNLPGARPDRRRSERGERDLGSLSDSAAKDVLEQTAVDAAGASRS